MGFIDDIVGFFKGVGKAGSDLFALWATSADVAIYIIEQPEYWIPSVLIGAIVGAKAFYKLVGPEVAAYGAGAGGLGGLFVSFGFFGDKVIPINL